MTKKRRIGFAYDATAKTDNRVPGEIDKPIVEPNPAKQDIHRKEKIEEQRKEEGDSVNPKVYPDNDAYQSGNQPTQTPHIPNVPGTPNTSSSPSVVNHSEGARDNKPTHREPAQGDGVKVMRASSAKNIYEEPDGNEITGTLPAGEVEVLEIRDKWAKISNGWIKLKGLKE